MPSLRRLRLAPSARAPIADQLEAIRREAGVEVGFPAAVTAEAERVAAAPPAHARLDLREIPFVTIDPPGSRDLDQALHVEPRPRGGWRVRYAIADVAAWVAPGGAIDAEAHQRALTVYAPGGRAPLHPPVLSEGAASLLPDQETPAVVWTVDLDADGVARDTRLERALVRSRAQLDYEEVQRALDAGGADPVLEGLRGVGRAREEQERARGGVSLEVPEQEVELVDGAPLLSLRRPLPVEGYNAQVSLLCGLEAARIMLAAGTGLLRTQAAPTADDVTHLRRAAAALCTPWPETSTYPAWVRTLDPALPAHAAALFAAAGLGRSAGYLALPADGGTQPPTHFALAAPYAHVTAPLRRLGDRYALECCLAHLAGRPVPEWALVALPALPDELRAGERRAREVERTSVELVEALLLEGRVGERFDAVVLEAESDGRSGTIAIAAEAVIARADGPGLIAGRAVEVLLAAADPARRRVRFALAA